MPQTTWGRFSVFCRENPDGTETVTRYDIHTNGEFAGQTFQGFTKVFRDDIDITAQLQPDDVRLTPVPQN